MKSKTPKKVTKKINKGGRPRSKLTVEQIDQVETLAAVLTKGQMCDYFGMANNTFDAICARQPEVFEKYKRGKADAIQQIANNLVNKAKDGNIAAAIFYLKTQAGWRETEIVADDTCTAKPVAVNIEVRDARKP